MWLRRCINKEARTNRFDNYNNDHCVAHSNWPKGSFDERKKKKKEKEAVGSQSIHFRLLSAFLSARYKRAAREIIMQLSVQF